MGGDERYLAGVVEAAPDLAHLEPAREHDPLLGEGDLGRAGVGRAGDRRFELAEIGLGPVLALEILVPGDDGDAPTGETPEQRGAPALTVEDERHGRRAGVRTGQVGRIVCEHAERLELRNDLVFEGLDHLRVKGLVQA